MLEFGVWYCEEYENCVVVEVLCIIVYDIRNLLLCRCREFLFIYFWDFVVVDFEFEGLCKVFFCLFEIFVVW